MADMWGTFVRELQKTLGGGPGKEGRGNVANFTTKAAEGGKRVLGLASTPPETNKIDLDAPPPPPEGATGPGGSVDVASGNHNIIDLNGPLGAPPMPMESAVLQDLPIPAGMPTTPASLKKPGGAPTKLGAAKPKGSGGAGPASASSTPASAATDPIQQMLADRRAKLVADREKALGDAKSQESLTDDEKIAYALLGALPGLVGLVGGAAAGGGLGAAAGAAGGLQGGAQGISQIAAGKQEKRKEALAQAGKLQDVGFRLDDEDIAHLQHQGDQKFTAAQTDKTLAAHAAEGALTRANARDIERMRIFGDLMKGKSTGSKTTNPDGSPKLSDSDKNFYTNASTAIQNIQELRQLVKEKSNYSPATNPFADPQLAGTLNPKLYDTAVAYAKIVDPNSAAREGEVQSILDRVLLAGPTVPKEVTLQALDNVEKMIRAKAQSRGEIGVPTPANAQPGAAQAQQAPGGLKGFLGF